MNHQKHFSVKPIFSPHLFVENLIFYLKKTASCGFLTIKIPEKALPVHKRITHYAC